MMRSLFAGVSGLRNHQVRLDVIGNNIANVNTVGFKASRVTFKEAFAQLVQGASKPPGSDADVAGGTNPIQVGLGMNIGSIDLLFTQGNLETTGVTTDVAVQGDAFFVASDGVQRYYTRSGNFQLDASGRLVAPTNGFVVQGRMAVNGELDDVITDIKLPFGQKAPAQETTRMSVGGNLRADAVVGDTRSTAITVYDQQGARHEVTITFTKTAAANEWRFDIAASGVQMDLTDPANPVPVATGTSGTITFATDGTMASYTVTDPAAGDPALNTEEALVRFSFQPDMFGAGEFQPIDINLGTIGGINGLSQFAAPSTAVAREQNGYTMGNLERISIDQTGTITGAFTNGTTQTLAQMVLADFNNPTGLIRVGDNMYSVSPNSGAAVLGFAGEGSQSMVTSGALEMSNVDLAQEFTNMITAQRGFQSNARVITAADEMLQELVNLKR